MTAMEELIGVPADEQELWQLEVEAGLPQVEGPSNAELQADYLLERLGELTEQLRRIDDFTKRRIQMIEDHGREEGGKIQRQIAWLEEKVRFCVGHDPVRFEKEYKKKSIKLPHGQVGYKSSRETVEIQNPDVALAFAKVHGLEIKVTEKVNKTPLLEWVRANGEVPDPEKCGFELVPPSDSFFVKVG